MKNNRKNRNNIKINIRNKYRINRIIHTKAYLKIPKQIAEDNVKIIEYGQKKLLYKCNLEAIRELNKCGLKKFYLQENKIDNVLCNDTDDFVMDVFTMLVSVKYDIKFIN